MDIPQLVPVPLGLGLSLLGLLLALRHGRLRLAAAEHEESRHRRCTQHEKDSNHNACHATVRQPAARRAAAGAGVAAAWPVGGDVVRPDGGAVDVRIRNRRGELPAQNRLQLLGDERQVEAHGVHLVEFGGAVLGVAAHDEARDGL
eukprot:scaffold8377_cov353-Pinguiococcus_pyrenoidosus.AAC.4